MRRFALATAIVAGLMVSPAAKAQQQLFKETPEGWFIYREAQSCVGYVDFPTGTMLRFSNRLDERRMYFSAYNSDWEHLRPLEGQTVTLTLKFPLLARNYGMAAAIVKNPDGRMGFAAADLSNEDMLLAMASSGRMLLGVRYGNSVKEVVVEGFELKGGGTASLYLAECSAKYF